MLIDTHRHLDAAEFDPDRAAVLAAARAAGVDVMVVPAVTLATFPAVAETCRRYPGCVPAWGLHPLHLAEHRPAHLDALRATIAAERPVAVGEIGLDFHVPGLDAAEQERYLLDQLRIARDHDLPVLLHVRRAVDAVLKCLRRVRVRGGIAHAFNGSRQQADAFLALGFKLGFGGAMSFSGSTRIRALAAELPEEALVLETDAPDIPPAWLNGGRNAPGELPRLAAVLAELRGTTPEAVADFTCANARAALPGLVEKGIC